MTVTDEPRNLFADCPDEVWRWINVEGRDLIPAIGDLVPGTPQDPEMERHWVGSSGKAALNEGFSIYALIRGAYERQYGHLPWDARVLDFGCGWGRVIRFFLKDVHPDNLIGIDRNEVALEAAESSDRWSQYEWCQPRPPTRFDDGMFDLIYAYSVFSHLPEQLHLLWLREFDRILSRSGVLVLTTLGRGLIDHRLSDWSEPRDAGVKLVEYDRGDFCFRPLNGVASPDFGDAYIPERYIRKRWTKWFTIQEHLPDALGGQNVIVCTKRPQ